MNDNFRAMKTGAGRYIQAVGVINTIGQELKSLGHLRVGIIAGNRAYQAVQNDLLYGMNKFDVFCLVNIFAGHCTIKEIQKGVEWTNVNDFDCLIGVGGGKALDYSKAVGAQVGLPVFMVPTIAATCAAFAPLSVIYDEKGRQQKIIYHDNSVAGVFIDAKVIANAPSRYLAAGIADSFAKYCEYTSMLPNVSLNHMELGRYVGAKLACVSDEILLSIGEKAYEANKEHKVTQELEDVIACIIGIIGMISGLGSFVKRKISRFALAHGLNEVVRGTHIPDSSKFLHGEIVGVGVLAQMRANNQSKTSIKRIEAMYSNLKLPTRLSEIEINYCDSEFNSFINELLVHCHIDDIDKGRVVEALHAIR